MAKQILHGHEARKAIKKGIDIVADAVKPTLGAVGKSVIISMGGLDPIVSDDGVTVARCIELKDQFAQQGVRLMQKIGLKTNQQAGDGTSTSMVLGQAFINEAMNEIGNDGSKIRDVKERLEKGLIEVKEHLKDMTQEVQDDEIADIATISSLDREIGEIIADCFKKVGRDGVVTIEDSAHIGYSSEVVHGIKFSKGLNNMYFINEPEKGRTVLENPAILLADRRIASNSQIKNILDQLLKSGSNTLLIIALDVEAEALATLVMNHTNKLINVACVQAPHNGKRQKDFFKDLETLTGATLVSEHAGLFLDKVGLEVLGSASKVIVTMEDTTIVDGNGNKQDVDAHVTALKALENDCNNESDKILLKERIASLTGGIGVIRVGAFTETELRARKFKIEDAVNATKAALEEGIVAGGGTPLAKISVHMTDPMFKKALVTPLRQMAINAGMNQKEVVKNVQRWNNFSTGYDFKRKELTDLIDNGIIDPVKVTRLALESAISIASTMITADVAMVDIQEN